jgi:nitrate reductase delta subunit
MQACRILARLLTYPDLEFMAALPEIEAAILAEPAFGARERAGLLSLARRLRSQDLIEVEEGYVGLFDRVRSLSLHLFEHVHGESRARGQAMVDLLEVYRRQGVELDVNELPDYLPVFLEFLSLLPEPQVTEMLDDAGDVLDALHGRLVKRESAYATVFQALLTMARRKPSEPPAELEDESPEALDRAWEDQAVTFMGAETPGGDSGCSKAQAIVARMTAGEKTTPPPPAGGG